MLGATGLDPACLTLEITESALHAQPRARAAGVIQRLHAMSVGLHLDDFGTGYSSLAYLHSFPVHALKVDRSFVNRMDRAPQQSAIVKAIVSLAHNLGMEVIAEGIDGAQAEALRALRCRRGQGFLFSKPLPRKKRSGSSPPAARCGPGAPTGGGRSRSGPSKGLKGSRAPRDEVGRAKLVRPRRDLSGL